MHGGPAILSFFAYAVLITQSLLQASAAALLRAIPCNSSCIVIPARLFPGIAHGASVGVSRSQNQRTI